MSLRGRARRAWITAHRWLGLGLGGAFALLGLTGSVLVFYLEIDALLHPRLRVEAPAGAAAAASVVAPAVVPAVSPDAVLAVLRAAEPGRAGPWRIELPKDAATPVRARYVAPAERRDRLFAPLVLTLDPATLAVTSRRFWGDDPMTWIYDLHYALQLDRGGRTLVGLLGLAMIASLASGLALWWPTRRRWRGALAWRLRPGAVRRVYDLHALAGVYGLVVLAVLALTGAVLALPDPARTVIRWFSPLATASGHAVATHPRPRTEGGDAFAASLDAAVRDARRRFPGADVRWIETTGDAFDPIVLRVRQPGEPGRRFPQTRLWFDSRDGRLTAVQDPFVASRGDRFLHWMHPLHSGEAFGLPGRLLVCAGGLLPALLLVTGWLRWRHKRRGRASRLRGS